MYRMPSRTKCPPGSRKCISGKCVKRQPEKTPRCHKGTRKCVNQKCYSAKSKEENAAKKIQKMVRIYRRKRVQKNDQKNNQQNVLNSPTSVAEFEQQDVYEPAASSPAQMPKSPSRSPTSVASVTPRVKRSPKTIKRRSNTKCPKGMRKCAITGRCVVRKTEKTKRCHRGTRKCANNVCYSKTELAAKKIQKMVRNRSRKN